MKKARPNITSAMAGKKEKVFALLLRFLHIVSQNLTVVKRWLRIHSELFRSNENYSLFVELTSAHLFQVRLNRVSSLGAMLRPPSLRKLALSLSKFVTVFKRSVCFKQGALDTCISKHIHLHTSRKSSLGFVCTERMHLLSHLGKLGLRPRLQTGNDGPTFSYFETAIPPQMRLIRMFNCFLKSLT